jgi:fido (protein-threonine AMPylation protein)
MSAPSRVRVNLEFRNGNGHYLKLVVPLDWEPCKNEADIEAMEKAFVRTLEFHIGKREAVRKMLEQTKPPGHD